MDNKNGVIVKAEKDTDTSTGRIGKSPPQSDPPTAVKDPPEDSKDKNVSNEPLAPPPKPNQDPSDYFSSHNNSRFLEEPNPFEKSFGVPPGEASGSNSQSLLPPVAALTSPAPLIGGTPNNWSSLRSGPLSPAMLGGPVGTSITEGYFDGAIRGGFTPQESSIRTGLTPGGGGSMFPAPSPNSQALYQSLASGGATPSTLDFHRTAMNAAAARKDSNHQNGSNGADAQQPTAPVAAMNQNSQTQNFDQHDAANGLFMLAQAGTGAQANNQFAIPNPPNNMPHTAQVQAHETSPNLAKRSARNANGSIGGGSLSGSVRGQSEMSAEDSGDQSKPTTRNRGKRTSNGKGGATTNGRRKVEDTPSKQPAVKKAKTNSGNVRMDLDGMNSDEDEKPLNEDQYHENGKKMTDEEKRKNFLERNRVAALKCRQRKKQWLANLQAKVEIFSSENDSLSAQVAQMREEIVQLKAILIQHKECPVSQAQGLSGYFQQQEQFNNHANPYGMAMNGQQIMAGQRRQADQSCARSEG